MGSIQIRNFTGGLDTRSLPEVTQGGVLVKAVNCHVSRGGALEKRAAMVPYKTLPAGTTGLAADAQTLYVFGSGAPPAMPAGILYQRLRHPSSSSTALVEVLKTELFSGKLYAVGLFADGSRHHFYDGVYVDDWFDGRARASFAVLSALPGAEIAAITVGGVNILSAPITYAGDVNDFVAAIVQEVNGHLSSPDYEAVQIENSVIVTADDVGTAANGRGLALVSTGVTFGTTAENSVMAGGATVAETYEPGTSVKTFLQKMFAISGSVLFFSAIRDATSWNSGIGKGFIDMSEEGAGFEELTALAEYAEYLAIFAPNAIMVYYFDPDPVLSRKRQVLANVGTVAPKSIVQLGDGDVFFLHETGIRSLRARDSSNSAMASDIGNPIDTTVQEALAAMTVEQRAKYAIAVVEPRDGRIWQCLKRVIYVFSYFTGSSVSAWTTYETPWDIEAVQVFRRKVFLRSGNQVYVFGGEGNVLQYDDTVAEAWLPYLDANVPSQEKTWQSFDGVARGKWEVSVGYNPNDLDAQSHVATIMNTTYNTGRIPVGGKSTHVSMRFRTTGTEYASLSAAAIYHDLDDEEDGG